MHFETSPTPSPSQPISIGRMASPTDSLYSFQRISSTSPSRSTVCAYPSWPTGSSLGSFRSSAPSSFISDEDLFPEDLLDGESSLLHEAPAPPRDERQLQQAFPQMPLMPLYAADKPKKRRKSTSRSTKPRRSSKPMTPISESPETPE